jgi:hypothetical protein
MNRPLIIFLDLDGVFKNRRTICAKFRYDPLLSKMINDLCRLPETRVVISATCRKNFDSAKDCELYWRDLGMPDLKLHEHWYTTSYTGTRSVEIGQWLEAHHVEADNPEYLFVDDEFPNYDKALPEWTFDIIRSSWMVIDTNNGAGYQALYALRGMFDDRSKAYEKTEGETAAGESTGRITKTPSVETDQFHESQAINQFRHFGQSVFSYSADAKCDGTKRNFRRQTVKAHVIRCIDQNCPICNQIIGA